MIEFQKTLFSDYLSCYMRGCTEKILKLHPDSEADNIEQSTLYIHILIKNIILIQEVNYITSFNRKMEALSLNTIIRLYYTYKIYT